MQNTFDPPIAEEPEAGTDMGARSDCRESPEADRNPCSSRPARWGHGSIAQRGQAGNSC